MKLAFLAKFYASAMRRRAGHWLAGLVLALASVLWLTSLYKPGGLDPGFVLGLVIGLGAAGAVAIALIVTAEALGEQKLIVQRLTELQGQYGVAESLAVLGSWVYDVTGDRLYWSDGAYRVFGADPAETAPSVRGFLEAIHPEDRDRWLEAHRRGIHQTREARLEYRYNRADGQTIWVRSVARSELGRLGRTSRLAGIVQDVTAMRSMAQQLATSEAMFRDLTQLSSDWVWETDADHRLSFLSDTVATSLGEWAKDGIGRRHWEVPNVDFPKADWDTHRADLIGHRPFEDFQFTQLDPDGGVYHVSISGRPILDDAGRFTGYRGVGRDITRELQQQLLLQIESEMASIMREQSDQSGVIASLIVSVCGLMGWMGGAHMVLIPGTRTTSVNERWGSPGLMRMLDELPSPMPFASDSIGDRVMGAGDTLWIQDLDAEPEFAARFQASRLDLRAAFLAPIRGSQQEVTSALLFFSPIGFKAGTFLEQVGEILSRTLSLYVQRKDAEKRLMHASQHDALTGLPNRVYLTHLLERRLEQAQPAAVLYVDLDRYKLINDSLGHSVGDQVLIEVARRMREAIRPQDVAGRIGGDEFILLVDGAPDRAVIEATARKVLEAIEKPFILMNRAYFLSASIGIAVSPDDSCDAQTLIKHADGAMYQVKSEGRNGVRFSTGGQTNERSEHLQLAAEFPLAMQRGEVDLFYQPVLAVGERRIVGIEALMRWRHPTRGLLLPEKFLPAAEQGNLVREVGLWAIRRALDDRVELGLDRYEDVAISINVSPRLLAEEGFLGQLNALLTERDFPARLLRLELTENALIDNSDRTVSLLTELRRLGVKVIIDNFGTGYASLSYLKNLPIDGLKIDRTFIQGLPDERGNAAIVQAVTTLAGKLGLQAMAEGVQTAAEMRALRSYGCDRMQGGFISEPMALGKLRDFLETLPQLRQMHLVRSDLAG